MNIQEIANEHSRKLIKNIFSKLDDEEKYVLLELNNQLQDKINKIDKAIEYIKHIRQSTFTKYNSNEWNNCLSYNDDIAPLLEILGDKDV